MLCIENSRYPDFVTERIYNAWIAGPMPIQSNVISFTVLPMSSTVTIGPTLLCTCEMSLGGGMYRSYTGWSVDTSHRHAPGTRCEG